MFSDACQPNGIERFIDVKFKINLIINGVQLLKK